jgi:hypothetical protein
LLAYLQGREPDAPRDFAVSEYDYSRHPVCAALGIAPRDARMFMVATHDWKLVHCEGGIRPMLFNLRDDPEELFDLGADPAYDDARAQMYKHLHNWSLRMSQRITVSDDDIARAIRDGDKTGVLLGVFDETDTAPDLSAKYRGPVPPRRQD